MIVQVTPINLQFLIETIIIYFESFFSYNKEIPVKNLFIKVDPQSNNLIHHVLLVMVLLSFKIYQLCIL